MDMIEDLIDAGPVIPVLNLTSEEEAVQVCLVLFDAGLRVFEITLRNPNALASIKAVKASLPGDALIGAGTILSPAQLVEAKTAGASFGVSPGLTGKLATAAQAEKFPFLPGVSTVSEAMTAQALGFSFLKFFPAEASGGTSFLRSIAPVLPDLKFCPTGGITPKNAGHYLALENVQAVGGSWTLVRDKKGQIVLDETRQRAETVNDLAIETL